MTSYLPSLTSSSNCKSSTFNCIKKILFLFVAFLFIAGKSIAQTVGFPWIIPTTNTNNLILPDDRNLGINFPSAYTGVLSAKLHLQNNTVGNGYEITSSSKGLLLENITATSTTTTATQSSPAIVLIGHGLKPATSQAVATDKLLDFKIDVSNTSTPFNGGTQVLWGNDYAAFRVQKRSAATDIYSDFFSITTKIEAVADLSLRLGQSKLISNSGGANIIHASPATSAFPGTLLFENHAGDAWYSRLTTEGANAGNFAIGPNVGGTNSPIQSSAILQLESTNKGFLMPRVNGLSAITNPAEGLMAYDKSATAKAPYFYDGTKWNKVGEASGNPNVMYVSPKQFGAKFDGLTDDIDALYATYNYCNSLPYNKLVVIQMPPGICRITRPWVIGPSILINSHYQSIAKWVSESDCYRSIIPQYGYGDPGSYNSSAASESGWAKPVSIEGSGATAIYLDFVSSTLTAGIYYAARGNTTNNMELYSYHISGLGIYGKGYFDLLPENAAIPTSIEIHLDNDKKRTYEQITNNQAGIVCPNINKLTIENCTFRDLQQAVLISLGYVSLKNCHIVSCVKGYYCWGAAGSTIENVDVSSSELAFEIRSSDMTVTNIYTGFCPTSLWVGTGTSTFTGCYFESSNGVDGSAQVIIGNNAGEPVYQWFPDNAASARLTSGIVFNSLTIVARKPNPDSPSTTLPATALWMKQTAQKVSINGGFIWDYKKLEGVDNNLTIRGVDGLFTDDYSPESPGIVKKVSIQDINGSFRRMTLTNYAVSSSEQAFRPLCMDRTGKIVPCNWSGD